MNITLVYIHEWQSSSTLVYPESLEDAVRELAKLRYADEHRNDDRDRDERIDSADIYVLFNGRQATSAEALKLEADIEERVATRMTYLRDEEEAFLENDALCRALKAERERVARAARKEIEDRAKYEELKARYGG